MPPGQRQSAAPLGTGLRRRKPLILGDFDVGMAGKKIFRGGGSKKCENFFSHFWVLFDVDFSMKEKKTAGAHTSLEIWALQKFGPRGLETLFCRFLRFCFLGTRVHPHPPPTTYWWKTNLKYDFGGLGTTGPHQPPKNAGWLAPWATAKGRTPWDGASPQKTPHFG